MKRILVEVLLLFAGLMLQALDNLAVFNSQSEAESGARFLSRSSKTSTTGILLFGSNGCIDETWLAAKGSCGRGEDVGRNRLHERR